ncbi:MAG: glycosyltransferase family 4 protein [Thermoplasmatota archaeon]
MPDGGGLERYAREMALRWVRAGHEVTAIAFRRAGPRWAAGLPGVDPTVPPAAGPDCMEREDAGVRLRLLEPHVILSNTPLRASFRRSIENVIDEVRPDVVVAHGPVPFPLEMAGRALRHKGDIAFVPTLHSGPFGGPNWVLKSLGQADRATFFAQAMSRADRIVAVSDFVRRGVSTEFRDRVRIVSPGVDLERFTPGPPPEPSCVLFAAPLDRAYAWKGFPVLYAAARKSPVRLLVAGDGNLAGAWKRRAARDGVDATFLGRVPDEAVVPAFHRAGVVVLPSLTSSESFGMVLLEGNACGRPVIGSRVGGIPCFVRHAENGLLVKPGRADDLAKALSHLIAHPEEAQRMGREGRRLVEAQHSWDTLAARFLEILNEAIVARGNAGLKSNRIDSPKVSVAANAIRAVAISGGEA